MPEMKRRDFLKSGTMAVAAAGVAAAIPVVPAVVNVIDTEGPEADSATAASTSEVAVNMAQPLIVPRQRSRIGVHADVLRNARSGLFRPPARGAPLSSGPMRSHTRTRP